jgi:exosortase/archaeosortase family protein
VLGAFLANILRVFLIMVFGAHVSKTLALGLYHSYSGMILFLIYFIIFWLIFYKWMKKKGK